MKTSLPMTDATELRDAIKGEVLVPGDDGYETGRRIWNAMIDRRPAVIVRCADTADVVRAVGFAREHGLPLAVRGGGHNIAGNAVVDDGVLIDLSLMKAARVDPVARRVVVEGGARLADLDAATLPHGLATPVGINSTTGVGGLTLGGGFGWLSRRYGLSVDNLESAEIVTATGQVLRASALERPDLFWAIRGGGGNFGVVTRFEFRLHPVGPDLLSGLIVYPESQIRAVLTEYREFATTAPEELSVWAVLRKAPPLPFLPDHVHGQNVVVLALLHTGPAEQGERLIEPLRRFGTPVGEHVGVAPFAAWQQAFDPLLTAGARNYWKSHNLMSLEDGLIDRIVDTVARFPTPHCEIFIAALGGATTIPTPTATAYPHRDTQFVMNLHGRWEDPADDAKTIAWTRDAFEAVAPFASGSVYVNFMTADETERVGAAYGPNHARLAQIKRKYDPENLFRMNQNIRPA
jgi:FAD/FMN-containing dehydrogenase